MTLKDYNINKEWTLFLDRDGVINRRLIGDYILKWEQFEFLPDVLNAFKIFSSVFGKIIIVTNQQCIGKGLITEDELALMHSKMISEIEKNGGRVDALYYAPQVMENNPIDRKPNVGMALKAKKEFPIINFKKSVMTGDSKSDMEFGHELDMINVLINEDSTLAKTNPGLINIICKDLITFAQLLL